MERIVLNADEVASVLCCSKSQAYVIIRKLNKELEKLGKIVVPGKVNRKYFESKVSV